MPTDQQAAGISAAPGGQHACVGCRRDDAIQSAAEAFAARKAELRELKAALDAQAKFLDNEQANNQEVSQSCVSLPSDQHASLYNEQAKKGEPKLHHFQCTETNGEMHHTAAVLPSSAQSKRLFKRGQRPTSTCQ